MNLIDKAIPSGNFQSVMLMVKALRTRGDWLIGNQRGPGIHEFTDRWKHHA